MSSSCSSATPTNGKHSPKHQHRAGREWPQTHTLHPISSPAPSHHPGLHKHPQSSVSAVRHRHTHPEFPHICQGSARNFNSPQDMILRYKVITRGHQGLKLGFTFLLAFHQKAFHPQHFKLLQIKQQQRCKTGLEST